MRRPLPTPRIILQSTNVNTSVNICLWKIVTKSCIASTVDKWLSAILWNADHNDLIQNATGKNGPTWYIT